MSDAPDTHEAQHELTPTPATGLTWRQGPVPAPGGHAYYRGARYRTRRSSGGPDTLTLVGGTGSAEDFPDAISTGSSEDGGVWATVPDAVVDRRLRIAVKAVWRGLNVNLLDIGAHESTFDWMGANAVAVQHDLYGNERDGWRGTAKNDDLEVSDVVEHVWWVGGEARAALAHLRRVLVSRGLVEFEDFQLVGLEPSRHTQRDVVVLRPVGADRWEVCTLRGRTRDDELHTASLEEAAAHVTSRALVLGRERGRRVVEDAELGVLPRVSTGEVAARAARRGAKVDLVVGDDLDTVPGVHGAPGTVRWVLYPSTKNEYVLGGVEVGLETAPASSSASAQAEPVAGGFRSYARLSSPDQVQDVLKRWSRLSPARVPRKHEQLHSAAAGAARVLLTDPRTRRGLVQGRDASAASLPVGTPLVAACGGAGHSLFLYGTDSSALPGPGPVWGFVLRRAFPDSVRLAYTDRDAQACAGELVVRLDRVVAYYVDDATLEPFTPPSR